jgi:hypothetical protein
MQPQMKMIIELSPDDLRTMIEEAVQKVVNLTKDRPVSRQEAGQLLGKSYDTIARMESKGELTRLHPYGQPRYSFLQVIQVNQEFLKRKGDQL